MVTAECVKQCNTSCNSNRSWMPCGCPNVKTDHTSSSQLVRSKLELVGNKQELALVRSKLVLGNKLELVQVRSKQVLVQVRSKLVLVQVRSKLVQVLRSKLGLVRSNRSLLCGIRTSLLR